MVEADARMWAEGEFGACELGDKRRTGRLILMASHLAAHAGQTVSTACKGDPAAAEGAYRLLRNAEVKPKQIAEGGFLATVQRAEGLGELLAVEDTTSLSYAHSSAVEELGDLGGKEGSTKRGFLVHSVLLVERQTGLTVGLIEQERWCRDEAQRGQRHTRKERSYSEKESAKWQSASERVAQRMGSQMARVIAVCDREADVYEYLLYKSQQGQRYIVRASWNRRLAGQGEQLYQTLEAAPCLATKAVFIPQRGGPKGRVSRTAQVGVHSATVTLRPPRREGEATLPPLVVNAVLVQEIDPPEQAEPLRWLLLTSEPVDSAEAALGIAEAYGLRWRIEDFHKAWKSGAGVEAMRLQSADNLERAAVITAFVAVRLLQLRERLERWQRNPGEPEPRCDEVLSELEWKVLHTTTTKKKPPAKPPGIAWAYREIAKLGGWLNTKRTGRASWKTFWEGWNILQDRVETARAVRNWL